MEKSRDEKQYLCDVLSWLVINSMRVDGIQFDLLCEQSAANVWRKQAFATLSKGYREVDAKVDQPALVSSLQVFRERVDFVIDNSVPKTIRYSEKITKLIQANRYLILN